MKKNLLKISAIVLAAALTLSGCSLAGKTESTDKSTESTTTYTASQNENTAKSTQTLAASSDTAADTGDAFSERDLSGEYDDKVVSITLGDAMTCDADGVTIDGSVVTITKAGTYIISGTLSDGYILIDAEKTEKIQLVLDGASITSSDFAAIYVRSADKVFVTLADGSENTLANGGSFAQIDENDVDAVIFSKDDLTVNGSGALTITSPAGRGIVCKDELVLADVTLSIDAEDTAIRANDSISIASGTYDLTSPEDGLHAENNDDETLGNIYIASGAFTINVGDDAIHANTILQIDGGTFRISAAEGLEATYIQINGGDISISASDDGVNAAQKSSAYTPTFEMNDGTLTIVMGAGDTDAVDSNGNIIINGGTIDITGNSSFDYDGAAQLNGGTVIVNGQQVTSLPNQFMGGGMGGFGGTMPGGSTGGFGGKAPGGNSSFGGRR
ncbi:MAG: carbohydrate-binding domain-containing protein [Oscillospiraceae bacterium]|nr:carbohydrate-binding domain-containing protein [Oscillospiraceae bacterium]